MEIRNVDKAIIISFVAGFLQSITMILIYIIYKYAALLQKSQLIIIIAFVILNEMLSYVLLRISMIMSKT